jgi:hypothetical protein
VTAARIGGSDAVILHGSLFGGMVERKIVEKKIVEGKRDRREKDRRPFLTGTRNDARVGTGAFLAEKAEADVRRNEAKEIKLKNGPTRTTADVH